MLPACPLAAFNKSIHAWLARLVGPCTCNQGVKCRLKAEAQEAVLSAQAQAATLKGREEQLEQKQQALQEQTEHHAAEVASRQQQLAEVVAECKCAMLSSYDM